MFFKSEVPLLPEMKLEKRLGKKNIRKKLGLFLALVSLESNCYQFRGHYEKYQCH